MSPDNIDKMQIDEENEVKETTDKIEKMQIDEEKK